MTWLFFQVGIAQDYSGPFATTELRKDYYTYLSSDSNIPCTVDPSYTNSFFVYLGEAPHNVDVSDVTYTVYSNDENVVSTQIDEKSFFTGKGVPIRLQCEGISYRPVNITVRINYKYTTKTVDYQGTEWSVTTSGYTENVYFSVIVKPLYPVTGVSLNSMTIKACGNTSDNQMIPIITPSNASVNDVEWDSEDPDVSVDYAGWIYAYNYTDYSRPVKVTVTTIDGGHSASAYITVQPGIISSIALDQTTFQLPCTQSKTLKCLRTPSCASVSVTYSSNNPSVARVTNAGVVTAGIICGTAIITAIATDSYGNRKTATATVQTTPYISSAVISGNKAAGFGNTLTITGGGFGSSRGSGLNVGYVLFQSADDGGISSLADDNDFDFNVAGAKWQDNLIIMELPSMIYDNSSKEKTNLGVIGSGFISVSTKNLSQTNSIFLNIPQSYIQSTRKPDGFKLKTIPVNYLRTVGGVDNRSIPGIKFTIDPLSPPSAAALLVIKRVFADLSCSLQLDISIDETSSSKNVIKFGIPSDPTYLMETGAWGQMNTTISSRPDVCYRDYYTITINSSKVWNYSLPGTLIASTEKDFYHAFLHEMGHVLCLAHLNTTGDLMWYNLNDPLNNIRLGGINSTNCANAVNELNTITAVSILNKKLTATPSSCIVPAKPNIFATPLSPWDVKVEWSGNYSDVETFDPVKAYIITCSNGESVTVTNGSKSYIFHNLTQNTSYSFYVEAQNDYGISAFNEISVTTLYEKTPPTPNISVEYTYGTPVITWSADVTQTLNYKIYWSSSYYGPFKTTPFSQDNTNISKNGTLSVEFPGLGKSTFFKIVAYNDYFESVASKIVFEPACSNTNDITLNTYDINNQTQYAPQTANINYILNTPNMAVVEAGKAIHITSGFSAKQGSLFHASIAELNCFESLKSYLIDTTKDIISTEIEITKESNITKNILNFIPQQKDSNNTQSISKINIFPNPTKGLIKIEVQDETFSFELYNTLGILIKKDANCINQKQIDISNYVAGSYFLKVTTKDNRQESLIIFKQ